MKSDIKPLFIIGAHRSGTTWVANALCNHSAIYGIQSEQHYGIVESWFFSHLEGRFGDISNRDNYHKFLSIFSMTAFYKESKVKNNELSAILPRDYADFLNQFMVIAARKKNAVHYWVEKTPLHTLYLDRIIKAYPQARFIIIYRSLEEVLNSSIRLKQKSQCSPAVVGHDVYQIVWHWYKYRAYGKHFEDRFPEKIHSLHYHELVLNPHRHLKSCLDYLGLPWESQVEKQSFQRNTSYSLNDSDKVKHLNKNYQHSALQASKLAKLIPYGLFWLHEHLRKSRTYLPIPFLIENQSKNTEVIHDDS